jgi:hypothetical protein
MTSETQSYDQEQNTVVDSTRGNLLTDVQMSAESVPMVSTVTQMALNDNTIHEIKSILERPVNLGTFEWKTADVAIPVQLKPSDYDANTQNFLQQFNFPQDIFANSTIAVDKLKNYQYMKADIEIEVKINAQPFLQGALMLVYNPYYNQTGDFRRKGTRFLASQTSCPYKVVSIEEGNSLKITCPYANIYDLFDLSNSQNQFGTVFLYVFSNLIGASAAETAKYTVFARFINPQFFVPTSKDVLSAYRDEHDIRRLTKKGYRVAQANVSPVAARDTGEVETKGPISKIAGGVSTVADVLSGVPVIGKAASMVAWVSRAVGRTAAVFGLSKPVTIVPQEARVIKPTQALIHTEGKDDSVTLALLQDNGIDGSSFIPENKDEMSLAYLFGRPNFFHVQTAPASKFSARQLITSWEVSPLSEYQYGNVETADTMYMGSFAYASMMGSLWTGSINYDIMVVKTPYHQGRFAVVFFPETNLAELDNTSSDQLGDLLTTNYNVVCNLKDRQDENGRTFFRISVPFISNTLWRETYKRSSNVNNPGPDATTLDTKTGVLAIYSLVDLSSPPTVADQVTFFIAHSGGDDYQIARPIMNLAPGFQNRYAQSDVGAVFIPDDENLLIPTHKTRDPTAQTTGEYFLSLRALSKRFGLFGFLSQIPEFVGFRTRKFTENDSSGARVMSQYSFNERCAPTPWYMISFLFRFYNGSSMLKIIPPTPSMMTEGYLRFDEIDDAVTVLPQTDAIGQPVFQQLQMVSNAYEIRSPYYRGIRADVVGSTQVPVLNDVRTCIRSQNRSGFGSVEAASYLYEAAGDDFNFFFMIGPPPMMDIKNVTEVVIYPTGNAVDIDFGVAANVSQTATEVIISPVKFVPTLAVTTTRSEITQSDTEFVTIVLGSGAEEKVPVIDCQLQEYQPSASFYIPLPLDPSDPIDATQTLIALIALGAFGIITNAPLA